MSKDMFRCEKRIDLDKKYFGQASVDRLKRVFSYFLIAKTFENYPDIQIEMLAKGITNMQGPAKGQFPTDAVVIQLAQDQINRASAGIDWFLSTLEDIYGSYKSHIHSILISNQKYHIIRNHTRFYDILDKSYEKIVNDNLSHIRYRWKDDINIFSRKLEVDVTIRNLFSLMRTPLENIVISHFTVPNTHEDEEKLIDKVEHTGVIPEPDNPERLEPDLRLTQKKNLIEELRALIFKYSDNIEDCDFIDGGLVALQPLDWAAIDFNYLRRAAREYYFFVLTHMVFNFESMLNYYFIELVTEDPERMIQQKLGYIISDLDDDEIADMALMDPVALKKKIADAQKEYDDKTPMVPYLKQIVSKLH